MKVKKKTWILVGVVVFIYLLILVLPDHDKRSKVKTLDRVKKPVTAFSLTTKSLGEVSVEKTDDRWYVSKRKYAADIGKVEEFLKTFSNEFELEVVSLSRAFSSYDLDEENRTTVSLIDDNGNVLRSFHIGKSANRYRSRYVSLDDEVIIYASITPIGNLVDVDTLDDLRDKTISTFVPSQIISIGSSKGRGASFIELTLQNNLVDLPEKDNSKSSNQETNQETKEENKKGYVDKSGKIYDYDKVQQIVEKLSSLKAKSFFEIDENRSILENPLVSYRYKLSDREEVITIYEKTDQGYPLTTSFDKQGYFLPFSDGEELQIGFDEL